MVFFHCCHDKDKSCHIQTVDSRLDYLSVCILKCCLQCHRVGEVLRCYLNRVQSVFFGEGRDWKRKNYVNFKGKRCLFFQYCQQRYLYLLPFCLLLISSYIQEWVCFYSNFYKLKKITFAGDWFSVNKFKEVVKKN